MATREKRVSDYRGFTGPDASLETSLFEYGIAWRRDKHDACRYDFIIGVYGKEEDGDYVLTHFDNFHFSLADYQALVRERWFDAASCAESLGMDTADLLDDAQFPGIMPSIIAYTSQANVFGSSCYPYRILRKGEKA